MSLNKTELNLKLQEFSKKILVELVKRIKESRKVYVPDLSSMRFKNGKIEYFFDSSMIKEVEKKELDFTFEFSDFYHDFCQKLGNYEMILNSLKIAYQLEDVESEQIIRNFIGYIIYKNDKFSKGDKLKKEISGLLEWLEKPGTRSFNIKIFLEGIWVNDEELQILEDLKIRRIKSSDFEFNSSELMQNNFSSFQFKNIPYTILKWKYHLEDKNYNPIQLQSTILKDIRMLIYSFLFFRLGSVFSRKSVLPSGILGRNLGFIAGHGYGECYVDFTKGQITHSNKFLQIKSQHIYPLSKEDIPKLIQIISIFRKIKIKNIIFSTDKTYINIALNRFQNAFLNIESMESQISYGISCLEALFSVNPGELQRKLCQRISKLFNIFGFNPLVINEILVKGYRVRSKYSHGQIEKKSREELESLSLGILQCARISLLFFFQFDNALRKKRNLLLLNKKILKAENESKLEKERKKYFLKILDSTLIDDKMYEKLQGFIQKKFKIFL